MNIQNYNEQKKNYTAPIMEVINSEYTGFLCQSGGDSSGGDGAGVDNTEDSTSEP